MNISELSFILDTNIFIRFLTADNQSLFEEAKEIFLKLEKQEIVGFLLESVFVEIVFVLEKFYKIERIQVNKYLSRILQLDSIRSDSKPILLKSLEIYANENFDIVDCLIYSYSLSNRFPVLSFDKDLERLKKKYPQ